MENRVDKKYWTSLEDMEAGPQAALQEDSDVRSLLEHLPSVDRRSFLKLVGLSLATGALAGCRKPVERIIPYLNQPVDITPGVASWYATTCHGCTAGCGALARVMDGRPVKLEGNPDHLMSRGGLCASGQAAVLGLYSSHRQKAPAIGGVDASWDRADGEIAQCLSDARARGKKVVLLTGTLTGPATNAVIRDFLAGFPAGEHVIYDAVSYDAIREAHAQAYGRPLIPGYRFDKADVIVSFAADFLGTWLSPVEFTRQYAERRDAGDGKANGDATPAAGPPMSRHYQFESRLSLTGSNADHRFTIAPSEQEAYVAALAVMVARARGGNTGAGLASASVPELNAGAQKRLAKVARALAGARGRSLVVCDSNDPAVQLAVLGLNEMLGNVGHTVDLERVSLQKQGRDADMARLIAEMRGGKVGVLLIHACNPAYSYPDAEGFTTALKDVPCSVAFAVTPDETAAAARYHCPAHHPMESWGDAEPQAGRLSLFQPTIRPLYQTRAFEDSLLKWSGRGETFHQRLMRHWQEAIFPRQKGSGAFAGFWDQMLQRGFIELAPPGQAAGSPRWSVVAAAVKRLSSGGHGAAAALQVEVYEPLAIRDGAAGSDPWLQELPDPISKIAWDNYAAISPALAREKGIEQGQSIEIKPVGRDPLRLPAHIQPGQHSRTISVALGYGRTHAGAAGTGVGANAYPLIAFREGARQTASMLDSIAAAVSARPYTFARTQIHGSMEGRPIVRELPYSEAKAGHGVEHEHHHEGHADLWTPHEKGDYHWGMVVDLAKCTGCSACVVACNVENNIPVVGRDEIRRQRDMHWMRIDRYFSGDESEPEVVHQPMMCQQCDNASCETVCPALATVHDDQGLNVQVYNRCVGTRYCANNCPYKTRRFNFFNNLSNDLTQNLALNPDVTVRSRGVMEKCSFCIQRIQSARIEARREGRKVKDGEVRTACEQSCPAGAIIFGNLADPQSRVSRLTASPRGYRVLEELNRQPSVHYLANVRNKEEEA